MKRTLFLVLAVFAHVHALSRCGCPKPVQCTPLPSCSPIEAVTLPYEVTGVALPTCNCPTAPSLPVSPQIIPAINAPPFLGIPPCLGGVAGTIPLGMINPFLPASSPVSALAPTVSNLYPPINPCNCGCKYLKKIPIPPPCL